MSGTTPNQREETMRLCRNGNSPSTASVFAFASIWILQALVRESLPPSSTPPARIEAPQAESVGAARQTQLGEIYGKLPLSFEQNQGQVDGRVRFLSRGEGYTLFLTASDAVLALAVPGPKS